MDPSTTKLISTQSLFAAVTKELCYILPILLFQSMESNSGLLFYRHEILIEEKKLL